MSYGRRKWEQSQMVNWKKNEDEISSFFGRFNLDVRDLYKHVMSIDYDKMQAVCYLLSKIDKAIKICDFLDGLERGNHEDVDVIKIYILVSHAEISSRSLGKEKTGIKLVKEFFSPVASSLKHRIKPSLISKKNLNLNFADILYKLRCEYTHEGNYTGRIFKRKEDGKCFLSIRFKIDDEYFYGKCDLAYKEFIEIYMEALIENIKKFSNYGKQSK
ncbi:MAG: hypothetical protein PHH35_00860 [Candidatus Pacebacteria bacterium]|jgi:hypothetical protein|nr:hypothetical protein [Candidatus Paceibacterota bacterium]